MGRQTRQISTVNSIYRQPPVSITSIRYMWTSQISEPVGGDRKYLLTRIIYRYKNICQLNDLEQICSWISCEASPWDLRNHDIWKDFRGNSIWTRCLFSLTFFFSFPSSHGGLTFQSVYVCAFVAQKKHPNEHVNRKPNASFCRIECWKDLIPVFTRGVSW